VQLSWYRESACRFVATRFAGSLASVLNDFGVLCKYTGRFAEAKRMYRRTMMLIGRVDEGSNYKEFVATLYHN
jgi:hypothetical protein